MSNKKLIQYCYYCPVCATFHNSFREKCEKCASVLLETLDFAQDFDVYKYKKYVEKTRLLHDNMKRMENSQFSTQNEIIKLKPNYESVEHILYKIKNDNDRKGNQRTMFIMQNLGEILFFSKYKEVRNIDYTHNRDERIIELKKQLLNHIIYNVYILVNSEIFEIIITLNKYPNNDLVLYEIYTKKMLSIIENKKSTNSKNLAQDSRINNIIDNKKYLSNKILNKKLIYSHSFGCAMNVYDVNRMVDIMKNADNYEQTDQINDADLIIINTCSIREKAKDKLFSEIGRINENRKRDAILVVAGCVAQMASDEIKKKIQSKDIVIGATSYHKLPELVKSGGGVKLDFLTEEKFKTLPQNRIIKGVSEFIAVQEGCDKFCSYCIVPFTRGREYSRDFVSIIDEAKVLADKGVKEITLLGQNVDNYNANGKTLADLIKNIDKINGIERIRYMTSYPTQVRQDLMECHRDIKKLMPFIHLPIQSGSNDVLKRMNRKYTREIYMEVIEKLRAIRPDIAISSDFIVGFAGETDRDFENTLDLCRKVKFATTFSFKYSIRPHTAGEKMDGQVEEKVKEERLKILQTLLNEQQLEFNKQFEGQIMEVLIESLSTRKDGRYFGKSPYLQTILCNEGKIGEIMKVRINKAGMKLLEGKII